VRRILLPLTCSAAALTGAVGLAACNPAPDYAAKVNGHVISRSTLDGELQDVTKNQTYVGLYTQGSLPGQQAPAKIQGTAAGTFDGTFVASRLTNDILYELVREEVVRRHLTVTAADLTAARDGEVTSLLPTGQSQDQSVFLKFPPRYQQRQIDNVANQMVLEHSLAGRAIDAAAIQKYYDQHKTELTPTALCLSDIAVTDQATATALKTQLDAGASFTDLAKAQSKDTQTAPKGGDAGCIPAAQLGTLVQTLATVAVGKVSAPIQGNSGFLLIKVNNRQLPTLAAATPQIRQQLLLPAEQALNTLIRNLAGKAKVTVNPRYGTFHGTPDPTTGFIGVQPPGPPTVTTAPNPTTAPAGGLTPGSTLPGQQPAGTGP
jgi:hypothetical protein